jgi:prepilin-type N-terminal cleavage/methylation domain-containing protein
LPARQTHSRHGFTLIEILAVVLIIGLTFGFFLPNLDATRGRRLEERARELAGLVQVARERAVVTSAPHRIWIDLEAGAIRVDWFVDEDRALRAANPDAGTDAVGPAENAVDARGRAAVSLEPPQATERDYFPVPGRFGRTEYLPEDFYFVGVETPEDGFIDQGEIQIVFGRDGTTDYAEIVLADAWENEIALEIQPLLDTVRLRDPEDARW